jgi:hypothetical protein
MAAPPWLLFDWRWFLLGVGVTFALVILSRVLIG